MSATFRLSTFSSKLCMKQLLPQNSYRQLSTGRTVYPNNTAQQECRAVQLPTTTVRLLQPNTSTITPVRYTNFYNKHTASQLWKGVVSVSSQGAKKGRGRNAKKFAKNLNRGQHIGVGPVNMAWPGLNSPVIRGQEILKRTLLEPDLDRESRLQKLREDLGRRRRFILSPLERGWSGSKMGGRKMGPPDPTAFGDTFDGFDSVVVEFKVVSLMTGQGRKRSSSVMSVTGNGEGVAGFALSKAPTARTALRVSKNKAGQFLLYIDRYKEHTVMHDFHTKYGITSIFVKKMPEGYGLVCHRVIKAVCEMVGIKDLHAKIEGACHPQNIVKAFFLGLIRQKSFQHLSDQKGLHIVEMREECYNYPTVMATPLNGSVRTLADIHPDENLDYNIHIMQDRVKLAPFPKYNWMTQHYGWEKHLNLYQHFRNKPEVRRELTKEYGAVKSFYFEKYPECVNDFFVHGKKADEEED